MLLCLKAINTHLADATTIQEAIDKLEGDGRHTAITHSSDNSAMVINEINPLDMTVEESLFLGKLLDEHVLASKQYLFQAGCNLIELKHPKTEKMMTIELNLKYPLLRRECEGNPLDYRYEIIGDELGSGSFSTVYKSKGVLAPQIDGSLQLKSCYQGTRSF